MDFPLVIPGGMVYNIKYERVPFSSEEDFFMSFERNSQTRRPRSSHGSDRPMDASRRAGRQHPRRSSHPLRNLLLAIVGLMLVGEVISLLTRDPDTPSGPNTLTQLEQSNLVPAATEPKTVVHIAAAGDLNITDAVIAGNQLADGSYDFTEAFLDVVPVLAQADLTVLNLEGNLCGAPFGSETGSAPVELARALANAGVDVVQTANSYSIRNGLLGMTDTLNNLHAAGLQTVGTATGQETRSAGSYLIREVGGIRIALVAFTKGMDNLSLPEGAEGCANLLYKDYASTYQEVDYDGIRQLLRSVSNAQPDYTIALLHWGSEYNDEISSSQRTIRNLLFGNGVNAIIGTHPHLVQEMDYSQEDGTFIAYSLGDFYGDATESGSNYSVILDLELTRDNVTGMTSLTDFSYTPIFTLKPEDSQAGGLRVTTIAQAMELYDSGFAGRVTDGAYEDMAYALERLETRIKGK